MKGRAIDALKILPGRIFYYHTFPDIKVEETPKRVF
jgi:hypothetical protein